MKLLFFPFLPFISSLCNTHLVVPSVCVHLSPKLYLYFLKLNMAFHASVFYKEKPLGSVLKSIQFILHEVISVYPCTFYSPLDSLVNGGFIRASHLSKCKLWWNTVLLTPAPIHPPSTSKSILLRGTPSVGGTVQRCLANGAPNLFLFGYQGQQHVNGALSVGVMFI